MLFLSRCTSSIHHWISHYLKLAGWSQEEVLLIDISEVLNNVINTFFFLFFLPLQYILHIFKFNQGERIKFMIYRAKRANRRNDPFLSHTENVWLASVML